MLDEKIDTTPPHSRDFGREEGGWDPNSEIYNVFKSNRDTAVCQVLEHTVK